MEKGEFIQWHTILFISFSVWCQKVTFLFLAESHSNHYVPLLEFPHIYCPVFKSWLIKKSSSQTDTCSLFSLFFPDLIMRLVSAIGHQKIQFFLFAGGWSCSLICLPRLWSLASLEFLILTHFNVEQHPITSRDHQFCICAESALEEPRLLSEEPIQPRRLHYVQVNRELKRE